MSKVFDVSSATVRVARDLFKDLAILSDTTFRRSAVDWEDLKPYWKSEKRPQVINNATIYKFFNQRLY